MAETTPHAPDQSDNKNTPKEVPTTKAWKYVYVMALFAVIFAAAIIAGYSKIAPKLEAKCDNTCSVQKIASLADTTKAGLYIIKESTYQILCKDTSLKENFFHLLDQYYDAGQKSYTIPVETVKSFFQKTQCCNKESAGSYWLALLLVALCGGLGATIYILQSFTNFWGSGKLSVDWLGFYFAKPFIGMGLAIVFYFIVGARFVSVNTNSTSPSSPISDLNTLLALAFLVGLFTDKAMTKLAEVFDTILSSSKPEQKRPDTMASSTTVTPTIKGMDNTNIVLNDPKPTHYTISGTGLTSSMVVKCNDVAVKSLTSTDGTNITFDFQLTDPNVKTIAVVVTDPSGKAKDMTAGKITVTPAASAPVKPQNTITPDTIKIGVSQEYTLTGTGFAGSITVLCNSNPVTNLQKVDANTIKFTYQENDVNKSSITVTVSDANGKQIATATIAVTA